MASLDELADRAREQAQTTARRIIGGPPDGELEVWRRLAWPGAIAAAALARYSMESLRHRRRDRDGYELTEWEGGFDEVFRPASEALIGTRAIPGNKAEVLINGDRIFPPMLEAIRSATETVHFETYVYWQGDIAVELAEALKERAEAGVTCRVILDAIGSAKMDPRLVLQMREAGVHVARFRAPKPYMSGRMTNRTHRRVLVVDGTIAFTGGVGVAEEWTGDAQDPDHWRDTHVKVEGPVVRSLQGSFAEHWLEATGEALVGEANLPQIEAIEGGSPMSIIRSGAQTGATSGEILYVLALSTANESIEITSAYFAPRPPFVDAMIAAVDRGVQVRVLVPGEHTDKEFVRLAGRKVYEQLIAGGVEIYEYCPTMLHAKTMQIDGVWGTVGTLNFDNRSIKLNDEIALSLFDREIAAKLHEEFEHDLTRSEPVTEDRWRDRPWYQRVAEAATKPLRREL